MFSVEELKRETFLDRQDTPFYALYDVHRRSFWIPSEVDLSKDLESFKSLPVEEQNFIKKISTFFLISDALVCDNIDLIKCFSDYRDIRAFYSLQETIENTHIEAYCNIFKILFKCSDPKIAAAEIIKMPSVIKKRQFCRRDYGELAEKKNLALLILANTLIEGVFFAASFSGLFWLKKRGKCPGIVATNEWIARDERLHWRFGCELLKLYLDYLKPTEIYNLLEEVVQIETEFIDDILETKMGDITRESLIEYTKHCCNEIMEYIGIEPHFKNVSQPFEFMEFLNYQVKHNFFEGRGTNYSLPSNNKRFTYKESGKLNYIPL